MDGWKIVQSGSVLDLDTNFHFRIMQAPGTGMAPLENVSTDFGLLDGALFQRTRTNVRTFTLVGVLSGSSIAGLHADRKKLIDAVKPDRTIPQQSVVIQYTGAGSTIQASAYLDAGLELNDVSVYSEQLGLRFAMFDPYFEKTTSTSVMLNGHATIANANYILQRGTSGCWQALGTGMDNSVTDLAYDSATCRLYAVGVFTTAGGTTACRVGYWNGTAWTAMGAIQHSTNPANPVVRAVAVAPNSNVYVAGYFDRVVSGSTITACGFAKWNGSTWTNAGNFALAGGEADIYTLAMGPDGAIYAGGVFDSVNGTTACRIAKLSGSTWAAMDHGVNSYVNAIAVGPDGTVYIGGDFTATGSAGTTACRVAYWDGYTWQAQGSGMNVVVTALAVGPDSTLYAGGQFTTAGGVTACGMAYWNGAAWYPLSRGLTGGFPEAVRVTDDGTVYVTGTFDTAGGTKASGSLVSIDGGLVLPDRMARWRTGGWTYMDNLDIPGTPALGALEVRNNGEVITIGFDVSGTASAAQLTTVTNNGTANAYPILSASGPGKIFTLRNVTTNEEISFDLNLNSGETVELDLRFGKKTFTTSFRGNAISTLLQSSQLVSWHLAPGANTVALYLDDTSASARLTWTERFWSIDGGA